MADEFDLHQEPELVFAPLSPERYARFYDLEMTGFDADLDFYFRHCPPHSHILELGCGSGRLCRALAAADHRVTGLDLNPAMLKRATQQTNTPGVRYLCADMTCPGLQAAFDVVICAYHTLGLLAGRRDIKDCLAESARLLTDDGILLLQLHVPDRELAALGNRRLFQFQLFDLADGGRLIKETLKGYDPERELIILEERYRVRPLGVDQPKEDLAHTLHVTALSRAGWQELLEATGFTIQAGYGDYDLSPYQGGALLLLQARKRPQP